MMSKKITMRVTAFGVGLICPACDGSFEQITSDTNAPYRCSRRTCENRQLLFEGPRFKLRQMEYDEACTITHALLSEKEIPTKPV